MKFKDLQQTVTRSLMLLLVFFSLFADKAWAYDFSAVCSTGQTLYYSITDATNYKVKLTYPYFNNDNDNPDYWYGYTKPMGDITLPTTVEYNNEIYTVTKIGDHAFFACSGLTGDLIIPNTITSIERAAFSGGCTGLTGHLSIPNSVITIGIKAFMNCSGFTGNLVIPNSVTSIEEYAFHKCIGFTGNLEIPNSVTSIGDHAFYGCSGFNGTLTLSNSLTTLGESAFYECIGFTDDIVIPNSVTSIESWIFYGCSGFNGTLSLPNSVTSIKKSAFCNCTSLTGNLSIPNTVVSIDEYAFKYCSGLTGDLVIPNSVTSIGVSAFYGCSGFNGTLTLSNSLTTLGESAFYECIGFTGDIVIPNSVTSIERWIFYGCSGFNGTLSLPNSVTSIKKSAFCDCSGLAGNLSIPNSVTSIDDFAFYNCSGFTGNLVIPNLVSSIGYLAFYNCFGFDGSLTIGRSVTSIGESAFSDCNNLLSVTVPSSLTTFSLNVFLNCENLTAVYYEGDVAKWCGLVFDNAQGNPLYYAHNLYIDNVLVENLVIPNTVSIIELYAFIHATCLKSLVLSNSVTEIRRSAFNDCINLTGHLNIPNSITTIGYLAFRNCSGFTGDLVIPNSVTSIGVQAFQNCSGFTGSLTISQSVTIIDNYAFQNCSGLTGLLTIPQSVTSIGSYAFQNCSGLTCPLTIPQSVTSIGSYAFQNCSGLTGLLTIPQSVTSIGSYAFQNCSGFSSVKVSRDTPAACQSNSFMGFDFSIPVYVPCGATAVYSYALGWDNFSNYNEFYNIDFEVASNNAEMGSAVVTAMPSCDDEHQTTVTAIANEGYMFNCWTNEDIVVSTEAVYSFPLVDNTKLIANFVEYPWEPNEDDYPYTMIVVGVVNVDEVEQRSVNLEVGAFCGDECRGAEMCQYRQASDRFIVYLSVYGNEGDIIQFRLYDHELGYLDCHLESETVTFSPDAMLGTPSNPYRINFWGNYHINAKIVPAATGVIDGSGIYRYGETVTLTTTSNPYYYFVNWTEGDSVVSTSSTYSFTVERDRILMANFSPISYTIQAAASPSEGGIIAFGNELTVFKEATSNEYVPVYGFYCDSYLKSEYIMPSEYLVEMTGQQINQMIFYTSSSYVNWGNVNFKVFMKEVNGTTLNSYTGYSDASVVYQGFLSVVDGLMVITFDTPYTYNGGNLLIGFYNETPASYIRCYFYGQFVSGASVQGYGASMSGVACSQRNFLPKTTFVYCDSGSNVVSNESNVSNSCRLFASANENYKFVNWTENDVQVSDQEAYSFNPTSDRNLVANFIPIYTVQASSNPSEGGSVAFVDEMTVCDGGYYNEYVPVYGFYCDSYLKAEYIMPASRLALMTGKQINQMIFYAESSDVDWGNVNFKVFLKEVNFTTLSTYTGYNDATVVYQGSLKVTDGTMVVTFDTPYIYNGGNMLIGFYNETPASYFRCYFYGQSVSGASVQGYGTTISEVACTQRNFLPKTTFIYNRTDYNTVSDRFVSSNICKIAASANENYNFVNWTENDVQVSDKAFYLFNPTSNRNLVANFIPIYTVNVTADQPEGGMVTGAGKYNRGEMVTLVATANTGFIFVNWTEGNTVVSEETVISFSAASNRELVAHFICNQSIALSTGWNWFSSYIDLSEDGLAKLEDALGTSASVIKSRNKFVMFDSGEWEGSLFGLNNSEMYEIQVSVPNSFILNGRLVNSAETLINLRNGWSWIGYPMIIPAVIDAALGNLTLDEQDLLKSRSRFAMYTDGGWEGSLVNLSPGQGYMYKSTQAKTFTYTTPLRTIVDNVEKETTHWVPDDGEYADNMNVVAIVRVNGEERYGEDLEVGAFLKDKCVGTISLMPSSRRNHSYAYLTVFGDEGDEISFRLYDAVHNMEYPQTALQTIKFAKDIVFGSISMPMELDFMNMAEIDEAQSMVRLYPNPVRNGEMVNVVLPAEEDIAIVEVFDVLGVKVLQKRISKGDVGIPINWASGMYVVRTYMNDGTTSLTKLIVKE